MTEHITAFITALREMGLSISVAESLDALRAVQLIGVARTVLRESLAATLVKDEADRAVFDTIFERFFALPSTTRPHRPRQQAPRDGAGSGHGEDGGAQRKPDDAPKRSIHAATPRPDPGRILERAADGRERDETARRLAARRELTARNFADMSGDDAAECVVLAAELARRFRAHLSRRQRCGSRGRVDMRRTIRASIGSGGVPFDVLLRQRKPGAPDLVALCDCSYSVARASEFLLALLTPASAFFRRTRLFAYVDHPVEVSMEFGRFVPHDPVDLYARSDFGRVLARFWERHLPLLTRNTILLVLGDARNNRRPPRPDLLQRMTRLVRRTIWLNPEAPQRWNTADSVMRTYIPHCDMVLAATSPRQLEVALHRVFRRL